MDKRVKSYHLMLIIGVNDVAQNVKSTCLAVMFPRELLVGEPQVVCQALKSPEMTVGDMKSLTDSVRRAIFREDKGISLIIARTSSPFSPRHPSTLLLNSLKNAPSSKGRQRLAKEQATIHLRSSPVIFAYSPWNVCKCRFKFAALYSKVRWHTKHSGWPKKFSANKNSISYFWSNISFSVKK
ncbi:hypothetical protein FF38_01335 [Lucilia cuprina]|uniref:Uncharacterized protein n=1 Tax=Lucilia cuprina TaxID=7375 RepID=A0A0L0BTL6_LUCCU|nr:hypothetical protein FF38_01335 [Lucilia cuprina]